MTLNLSRTFTYCNDYDPLESPFLCLHQINNRMSQSFLQLNADKTEIIVFGKRKQRIRTSAYLNAKGLKTKDSVKELGVIIDSD